MPHCGCTSPPPVRYIALVMEITTLRDHTVSGALHPPFHDRQPFPAEHGSPNESLPIPKSFQKGTRWVVL